MSYKNKLPYILVIFNNLVDAKMHEVLLEELCLTYAKREFYDLIISYLLKTFTKQQIILEIEKIKDDNIESEIKKTLFE